MLVGPSVTPIHSRNPGFRIVDFDRDTWDLLDVHEYFLDLLTANRKGEAEWALGYSFQEAYGLGPTTAGLNALLQKMKRNQSLFQEYYERKSGGSAATPCDASCKTLELCMIEFLDRQKFLQCIGMNPLEFQHLISIS